MGGWQQETVRSWAHAAVHGWQQETVRSLAHAAVHGWQQGIVLILADAAVRGEQPETVPSGFRHLPSARRYALDP